MTTRLSNLIPGWLVALSGCSIAVLGAMGWITHRALTLEVAESNARAAATRQEAVRLALWRMDSWMTSLIAREAARPYFHYLSFYPADRPYSFYSADPTLDALGSSEAVSASPLLSDAPQDVKLYFQIWPDGHLTSPQVPSGGLRGLALLADANDSRIDIAASSLSELSQLLLTPQARQALGGEAAGNLLIATSSGNSWADSTGVNFARGGGVGGSGTGAPPFVGQVQSESTPPLSTSNPPTAVPPGNSANTPQTTARPSQQAQIEGDGKQRWQAANDYDARQQVAEATRNITQNQQRVSPYQTLSKPGSDNSVTSNAPANTPNTPNTATTESAATGDVKLDEAKLKLAKELESKRAESKQVDAKRLDETKAEAIASEKRKEADKEPTKEILTQVKEAVPTDAAPAGRTDVQTAGKDDKQPDKQVDKQADPRTAGGGTNSADVLADKALRDRAGTSSAAPPAPNTDAAKNERREYGTDRGSLPPGAPGSPAATGPGGTTSSSRLRSTASEAAKEAGTGGSFPVVVRSIAVDPSPLITACLPSPVNFFPPTTTATTPTSAVNPNTPPPPTTFNLFLTRQVPLESGRVTQGMWLDWPVLRSSLLNLSKDLVPGATLELCAPLPANAAAGDAGLMLASIPAKLVLPAETLPQISIISLLTGDTWSPTRIAIVGGWIAVLAGIVAIGWVLRQSVQLGERRGRFVSAVTHELRTPLTTFALYSQMLADGMVQDPEAQREYHQTLRRESDRLSRIVESVLDYARLGKRRSDSNGHIIRPAINAADLINTIEPHLRSRASVSGLELVVESPDLSAITLRAERDSIERILENLVENAGKYAAGHGTDQRLHLIAALDGRWLHLDIADHGPGIASGEARRIFAPFERGRAQQDGSKPGLGLGLAFARGLARDLGGDLTLLSSQAGFGAIFRLRIPAEIMPQNEHSAPDSPQTDGQTNDPGSDRPPTQ